MEKTGNADFIISNKGGRLIMRLPGGEIVNYDERFGPIELAEGESVVP